MMFVAHTLWDMAEQTFSWLKSKIENILFTVVHCSNLTLFL